MPDDTKARKDVDRAICGLKNRIDTLQMITQTYDPTKIGLPELNLDLGRAQNYEVKLDKLRNIFYGCSSAEDISAFENQTASVMDATLRAIFLKIEERIAAKRPRDQNPNLNQTSAPTGVKLPKLDLPHFDGKYEDWMSFRDLFSSSIKDNTTLSGAQKLQYLNSCLKGEAECIIKGISITDGNFTVAWKTLSDRYENQRDIVFALIKKLFNQSSISNANPKSIRKLIDVSLEVVRCLKVLGLPVDEWSAALVFVLTEKLDSESRREWSKTLKGQHIPTFKELVEFLEDHVRGLIAAGAKQTTGSGQGVSHKQSSHHAAVAKSSCGFCNGNHALQKCYKFLEKKPGERAIFVRSRGLCFCCFISGHSYRNCSSKINCQKCGQKHNTLLHIENSSATTKEENEKQAKPNPTTNTHLCGSQDTSNATSSLTSGLNASMNFVLLSTAVVRVKDAFNCFRVCRVLLDPGSESSFITEKCVKTLGLQPKRCNVEITGIASVSVGKAKGVLNLNIESLFKDFNFEVKALVNSKVTGTLPSFRCNVDSLDYLRGLQLADSKFLEPREVDILLGADVTGFLYLSGRKMKDRNSPVATETELGWVISGPISDSVIEGAGSHSYSIRVHHSKLDLDQVLQRFWELEQVPDHPNWTPDEKECEELFVKGHSRDRNGRYVTPLPFNNLISGLGSSRQMAKKRLEFLERRLNRVEKAEDYAKFMKEYEDLGHMELVPLDEGGEKSGITNFLPHHFVLREESTSTKLRVVFDGSAKTTSGISLNECLLIGPKVQDDLFFHLLRFRMYNVALKADIVKMFRQFQVNKKDMDMQRILWRDKSSETMREYRLKTVTYGTASAPHAAARCMKQISLDYLEESPEAARIFGKNFYVDDLLLSVRTVADGVRIQKELDKIAKSVCLEIGKWDSNVPDVLEHVSIDRKAKVPINRSKNNINVCCSQAPPPVPSKINVFEKFITKALGVAWDSVSDVLLFQGFEFRSMDRVTKRIVLSEMSRVFDPLGIIGPVTVKIKIFMQSLWMSCNVNGEYKCLDWDDELPAELKQEWDEYQVGMKFINEIKVPRCLIIAGTRRYELHGFSDASEKAYAAVLYLRCFEMTGVISTVLVTSKSRVAPMKSQSIPRLELCGALLLARLIQSVIAATSISCPIFTWTDSELVMKWISSSSRKWKTFVANRVSEIQELLPQFSWKFVPGSQNPADCASRGMTALELKDFDLWWNGPPFLRDATLPNFVGKEIVGFEDTEEKSKQTVTLHVIKTEINDIFHKYSSLRKLKRVFAFILRFNANCKLKVQHRTTGELTVKELKESMKKLVILAQLEFKGSNFSSLNPFVDKEGVLRVGGRLQKSKLSFSSIHPIILDSSHPLTKLIIWDGHQSQLHAGFQLLWAHLQQKYWIVGARSCIRNIIRQCLRCKRLKAKFSAQLMGSLPEARVTPSRPFLHTGVDYAGPFSLSLKKGRGMKSIKGYFCVFVCFATKAVHLELVMDLTTETFIATLKLFVSRRGVPSHIYSDCGTNFVGAEKELKALLQGFNQNSLVSGFLGEKEIVWVFNPPSGPHLGGLWEAAVKSAKYHLRRVIGDVILTVDEFRTVLCQVEAALNSRPIGPLSTDPQELDALTPGHFLIGAPLTAIPEPDLAEINENRCSRWQRTQRMFQHFWRRWSKEYLGTLQQRSKWRSAEVNFVVGDIVVIKDENAPPLKWKLGRVVLVHPGDDGLVRVVTVKTATGEMQRPIVKLCKLVSSEEK